MQFDPKDNADSFFKTTVNLEKEKSVFLKFAGMTLYTIHSLFSHVKFVHFIAIGLMILSGIFLNDYVKHTDQRMAHEKENNAIAQEQAKAIEDALMKKEKAKEDSLHAQTLALVETVKKITPEQMSAIKNHMQKIKDKEINKLKEVYWTYFYISNNDVSLNMESVNQLVSKQIVVVNDFYSNRFLEISRAYEFAKNNNSALISLTSDGANPLDKIITWDILTKGQQITFLDSTNSIIAESTKHLRSPVKLSEYLNANQEMIEKSKLFTH